MKNPEKNIPHINNTDKVILFDGECTICNAWCKFVIRHDIANIYKLASMQSKKGQDILQYLNKPKSDFKTLLLIDNNTIYEKSSAFIKIISRFPLRIKWMTIFQYIPTFIRDVIYDVIASNRYLIFKKKRKCFMSDEEPSSRYL